MLRSVSVEAAFQPVRHKAQHRESDYCRSADFAA